MNVTPSSDVDFDVTIERSDDRPADVDELPNAATELRYVEINATLESEEIENATFEFVITTDELEERGLEPEDVALYHYVDGEWIDRETTVHFPGDHWAEAETAEDLFPGDMWEEAETAEGLFPGGTWEVTYRAEAPHFSAFALAGDQPDLNVVDTTVSASELSVGEATTVETTVRNDGGAPGETDLVLEIDGTVVETNSVSVDPGTERVVTFTQSVEDSGEFVASVDGHEIGAVTVVTDSDDGADESESNDGTGTETDDTAATRDDADGTPGFGVLVAACVVLAIGALLGRSRSP